MGTSFNLCDMIVGPEFVRVFDEKFPVRNSLEQQVFTLGMHLICVSSGSYLQATEVSTYSSLLTL